jgi:hypothetical protein
VHQIVSQLVHAHIELAFPRRRRPCSLVPRVDLEEGVLEQRDLLL